LILMDYNQVVIAAMMAGIGNHKNIEISEDMIRHMTLNTIRAANSKHRAKYGDLIICADDKNYWRRDEFPYYKQLRKDAQKSSEINWSAIFESIATIREELEEYFPYKVIRIPNAEADDIIGTIVHEKGRVLSTKNTEQILILSGDKDFKQLHTYANVKQWDNPRKRWLEENEPNRYLTEHIIKGDRSDGIPNILSGDDFIVMKIRQKPVTKKRLEGWMQGQFTEEEQERYNRNKKLIDLSLIPQSIKDQVLDAYYKENTKDRSQLHKYLINNRLSTLYGQISDF